MIRRILFVFISVIVLVFTATAQDEARLLRFPAIHGNQIVFSSGGDLYTVDRTGGLARKLTNHIGYEMFARFSPDGKTIAFTGQYDGNPEVFTIPATGGEPKRLTYTATLSRDDVSDRMGPNNIVMCWTPDGKSIVYRSRRYSFNAFRGQLFQVPVSGGMSTEIPLHNGGWCTYSADGKKLAFNRVFREFRTWKYYTGGMTDDVWTFDADTKQVTNLTNNPSQDIFPMWYGDAVYFLSDRDRTMNMFVYDLKTKQTKKVTNFTDYDIKFPSLGNDAIIFEKGGFIWIFDLKTQQAQKVTIQIANDNNLSRATLKDASESITSADVSYDGQRLVFGARGDVFTVPAVKGVTRNLTASSNTHERNPVWSPDGKYIAYLSDKSGEFEIYIQKQDGSEAAVQITKDADCYFYAIEWSPDSKKILWSDRLMRLRYVDVQSKVVTLVDKAEQTEINSYTWSPDSKWIVYDRPEIQGFSKIYIYSLATAQKQAVTDGWFNVNGPVFSNDGKYLLFSSDRDFNPTYSQTEWNHSYSNMSKVYLVTLQKSTPSPFAPENNEVKEKVAIEQPATDDKAKKDDKSKPDAKKTETKQVDVVIDFDGIVDRTLALPIAASNYYNISCVDDKVYYIERSGMARRSNMKMYDLKKKKENDLGEDLNYSLTPDGKKMLVRKSNAYSVIDLPSGKIELKDMADLSSMKVMVNYSEEWKQIFDESWRQMRDFFFAPNMHGLDWKAMHDKYAVLVPYVKHRDDLTYIIGEMIAELNIGHAYVNSGQKPTPDRIPMGLLGAELSKHSSGFFKVDKILKGASWSNELRSPLNEMGVNVKVGDFIIAVNGKSLAGVNDIYETLIGTVGKQVELTVNSQPSATGARKTIVIPIGDESQLYYYEWVQGNIEKVNKATNGEVGYLHIPDMSAVGLNEFIKYFYPQIMKKGLIIDDRGNGGGNVSPMIIERLRREAVFFDVMRNQTYGVPDPRDLHLGPKVLLADNYSASDGDLFPARFKAMGIGKIIGVRTWGGVTGIRGSLPFIDGADLRKPEFARYSLDGKTWPIEGHGIDPDIMVDNDPYKEYMGEDQQLNKAIEVILEEIKNFNGYIKPVPPFPDKSK